MADVHSKEVRSYNMSQIKGKDTLPEIVVRKYLFSHGFRYRKNVSSLPGKPDIVLHKYRTCIFINGCFWHHHNNCKYAAIPQTRQEFWKNKFEKTIANDRRNYALLEKEGWNVLVIWECDLKNNFDETMHSLILSLKQGGELVNGRNCK